jgi:hypothetical protein
VLSQINAQVTKIERPGGTAAGGYTEEWDRPATDPEGDPSKGGLNVFAGKADAYYREKRERVSGAGADVERNILVRRSLYLDGDISIDLKEGDTVTFTYKGTERIAPVIAVEEPEVGYIGSQTRLTLTDA